ncbi:MAG: hypothetical protein HY697_02490 [Deltaproteobacteria bacterium]|nr:hypothetical protein [Deltaproteobacteria bacterium]
MGEEFLEEMAKPPGDDLEVPPAPEAEAGFSPELIREGEGFFEEGRQNLQQKILQMSIPEKVRLALVGNREARNILIREHNRVVPLAVLRSPRLTDKDVLNYAQQRNLDEEVFTAIAQNKKWMQNYPIKLALAANPKTPLPLALKLLDHLHTKDLQILGLSRNVSSVLSRAARRHHTKRMEKR